MVTYTYNYEIKDVDPVAKTMIVEYSPSLSDLSAIVLNLPIPPSNSSIDDWINSYAPQAQWQYQQNLFPDLTSLIGQTGTLTTTPVKSIDPADANSISGEQTVIEGFATVPANTVML